MSFRRIAVLAAALVFALTLLGSAGSALPGKPLITKPCTQCHQPAEDVVRGKLVSVSEKFKTLHVAVGKVVWVIQYDDSTGVYRRKESFVNQEKQRDCGQVLR